MLARYHYESFDDGQIVVLHMHPDFDIVTDMLTSSGETFEMLEAGPAQMVLIVESSQITISNLNDMLQSASLTRKPELLRVMKHPKMLKQLSVINNRLIHAAAKGLNTAAFGHFDLAIFESLDDALTHARQLLLEAAATQ